MFPSPNPKIKTLLLNYAEIQNIDNWSEKMLAAMKEVYGEENLRQLWRKWLDHYCKVHAGGGDICLGQLSKITCPTLLLHGMKDPLIGVQHVEYLHKNIPNSE